MRSSLSMEELLHLTYTFEEDTTKEWTSLIIKSHEEETTQGFSITPPSNCQLNEEAELSKEKESKDSELSKQKECKGSSAEGAHRVVRGSKSLKQELHSATAMGGHRWPVVVPALLLWLQNARLHGKCIMTPNFTGE